MAERLIPFEASYRPDSAVGFGPLFRKKGKPSGTGDGGNLVAANEFHATVSNFPGLVVPKQPERRALKRFKKRVKPGSPHVVSESPTRIIIQDEGGFIYVSGLEDD